MKTVLMMLFALLFVHVAEARQIKGKIKDLQTGEEIIGASVVP